MTSSRLALLGPLLAALTLPSPVPAQPPAADASTANAPQPPATQVSLFGSRYDGLRTIFADRGHRVATLAQLQRAPRSDYSDWVLVYIGDLDVLSRSPSRQRRLERVVRGGGSALVAGDELSLGRLSVRVRRGPVVVDPQAAYRQWPWCPLIGGLPDHELFAKVGRVAFNSSGYFADTRFLWSWTKPMVLRVPEGVAADPVPTPTLLVAGGLGSGRLALCADQGPFTNEMILEADNGRFADNLVQWLSRGGGGRNVVFVRDGREIDTWLDPQFVEGQWPDGELDGLLDLAKEMLRDGSWGLFLEVLREMWRSGVLTPSAVLDVADELVVTLEQGDRLDSLAAGRRRRLNPDKFARFVLVGGAVALLLMVGGGVMRSRFRDVTIELPENDPTALAVGDPLKARRLEVYGTDSYADPAARWAAQAFAAVDPDWRERPPQAVAGAGWFGRRRLKGYWNRATGATTTRMTARQFAKLRRRLPKLLARGPS